MQDSDEFDPDEDLRHAWEVNAFNDLGFILLYGYLEETCFGHNNETRDATGIEETLWYRFEMFTPEIGTLEISDDINIEDIKLSDDNPLEGLHETAADGMCVWLKNRWHLALFARHDGNWKRYYIETLDLQAYH